jgi:hypothetical protein
MVKSERHGRCRLAFTDVTLYEPKAARISEPFPIYLPAYSAGIDVSYGYADVPCKQWNSTKTIESGFDTEYVSDLN